MWECYSEAMTTHLAHDCFVFSKDFPSSLPSLHIFDVFPCIGVLFGVVLFCSGGWGWITLGLASWPFPWKPCNRYEEPESRLVCFAVTTSRGVAPNLGPCEQVQHQALRSCSAGAVLKLHIPLQVKGRVVVWSIERWHKHVGNSLSTR